MSRITGDDFKSLAEIQALGGDKPNLLSTDKIYVPSLNKTLDEAINDGDIGGGGSESQTTIVGPIVDFNIGKIFYREIIANVNFLFQNGGNGQTRILVINNTSGIDRTVTFPIGRWPRGLPITNVKALTTYVLTILVVNGEYHYAVTNEMA